MSKKIAKAVERKNQHQESADSQEKYGKTELTFVYVQLFFDGRNINRPGSEKYVQGEKTHRNRQVFSVGEDELKGFYHF